MEIKTVCYWLKEHTNRLMEQNREPRIDPGKYSQLTFDEGARAIQ